VLSSCYNEDVPRVTAIKPQKRKNRFNIYLDGRFAFGLDEETLLREKIKVGQDLSPERSDILVRAGVVGKLLDKALRFLSYRPRSEKEVRDHLWRKVQREKLDYGGESGELITKVIDRLRERGYVDDAAFASWWVEQRLRYNPRGKMLLRSELYAKGIERSLVEAELAHYSKEDEISWARRLVGKKGISSEKLAGYLSRRGFSWDIIREVLTDAG